MPFEAMLIGQIEGAGLLFLAVASGALALLLGLATRQGARSRTKATSSPDRSWPGTIPTSVLANSRIGAVLVEVTGLGEMEKAPSPDGDRYSRIVIEALLSAAGSSSIAGRLSGERFFALPGGIALSGERPACERVKNRLMDLVEFFDWHVRIRAISVEIDAGSGETGEIESRLEAACETAFPDKREGEAWRVEAQPRG